MKNISLSDQVVSELRAALVETPLPVDTAPPVNDGGTWPRLLDFAQPFGPNVRVMAEAPINWQWKVPMSAILFGSTPGSYTFEPSNGGKLGLPLRSPAGFPLRYAQVNGEIVGTPSVLYGDEAFNSDAEVFDLIGRERAAAALPVAPTAVYPQVDGQNIPATSLTTDADFKVVYLMTAKYPRWAYRHLSGTQLEINTALVRFGNDPSAALNWDVSSYAGPLKPWLNAA